MKKVLITISILFVIISTLSFPTSAYSDASGKHWNQAYAYYDNGSLPVDWQIEIDDAAYTWSASAASFTFYSTTTDHDITRQNYGGAYAIAWSSAFADGNYHIYDADTVFNTYYPYSTSGGFMTIDVQTVALHELGHWLVLDDLYEDSDDDKVMYYKWINVVKHSLTSDDSDGICHIYP